MIEVLLIVIIILVLLLTTIIVYLAALNKRNTEAKEIINDEGNKKASDTTPVKDFVGPLKRKDFRISLDQECTIEFIEFENKQLNKLLHKKIVCHLENISVSGVKILSELNLPVKPKIIVSINFYIKNKEFNLIGEIVRQEVHTQKNLFGYGIRFINMNHIEQKKLLRTLNEYILDNNII